MSAREVVVDVGMPLKMLPGYYNHHETTFISLALFLLSFLSIKNSSSCSISCDSCGFIYNDIVDGLKSILPVIVVIFFSIFIVVIIFIRNIVSMVVIYFFPLG